MDSLLRRWWVRGPRFEDKGGGGGDGGGWTTDRGSRMHSLVSDRGPKTHGLAVVVCGGGGLASDRGSKTHGLAGDRMDHRPRVKNARFGGGPAGTLITPPQWKAPPFPTSTQSCTPTHTHTHAHIHTRTHTHVTHFFSHLETQRSSEGTAAWPWWAPSVHDQKQLSKNTCA